MQFSTTIGNSLFHTEKIAHTESEIETRQAETDQLLLRLKAARCKAKNERLALNADGQDMDRTPCQTLDRRILLWERRLDKILRNAERIIPIAVKLNKDPSIEHDDSCHSSFTESFSDEDSSPSNNNAIQAHPSPTHHSKITSNLAELQAMVRESDQKIDSLMAAISANTETIKEIKETTQGYARKVGEGNSTVLLQIGKVRLSKKYGHQAP
mmetsp:Transcript_35571/g.60496  ORF Transcript_35571/g.60496 Transcript_35571/m.60496 type:complete len:212 (+) Transcript_35571:314-949(+)